MENLSILSQLVPAVAIALIFAYILINISKQYAESHREKTIAFMNSLKEQRESFLTELKDIRTEDREDRKDFRNVMAENTETTKNVLNVLKNR